MTQKSADTNNYSFPQKVWIAGAIFALIVVMLLLIRATVSVLLLVFAGILIAVFFHGFSGLLQRYTKWKDGICLTLSVVISLALLILLFWLIGAKVQAQVQALSETLPQTIETAKDRLSQSALGQKIVEKISSPDTQQKAQALVQTFFKSTFGVLGDVYVVLFVGIFFTVSPNIYKKGIIRLVPPKAKEKAGDLLTLLGENLKKWLKGKLFAMLVVFILTSIGLYIIGMPMWLTLALLAGLLNFIPNFGPILALIPASLLALVQSPSTALWVIGLYMFVQVVESNFITPTVQHKLVNIPPALIIIAQLLIAPLTNAWGLVLATPLMLVIIILLQELYIKQQEK